MTGVGGGVTMGGSLAALKIVADYDPEALVVADPVEWPVTIDDRLRFDPSVLHFARPDRKLSEATNDWRTHNARNLSRGLRRILPAKALGIPTLFGALFVAKVRDGEVIEKLGLASLRVITDAGVAAIADSFGNTFENETFNFHGMGTGSTAEAASQTALVTELTTEYNPNSTRATGVQTTPTNVYQTVGTNTIDSGTPAIVEHGIFSQAATGGGTMLDRSLFSAINLASGDGIQFTYQLTLTSGG
jgi:hypothetical protein